MKAGDILYVPVVVGQCPLCGTTIPHPVANIWNCGFSGVWHHQSKLGTKTKLVVTTPCSMATTLVQSPQVEYPLDCFPELKEKEEKKEVRL